MFLFSQAVFKLRANSHERDKDKVDNSNISHYFTKLLVE